jgi:PIN domain nuclease of toxin-antitoxin system
MDFLPVKAKYLRHAGYRILPTCETANALPTHHKDPMDRMLIALALDRNMTIITDNDILERYGVTTLW